MKKVRYLPDVSNCWIVKNICTFFSGKNMRKIPLFYCPSPVRHTAAAGLMRSNVEV